MKGLVKFHGGPYDGLEWSSEGIALETTERLSSHLNSRNDHQLRSSTLVRSRPPYAVPVARLAGFMS